MAAFIDGQWSAADGVRIHYRDYAGRGGQLPLLCLHGLTRNARDFDGLAPRLAAARRVIAIDFRGRGESGYAKDPMTYQPATYAADVAGVVEALGLARFAVVGTSLGGLVAMLIAAGDPARLGGIVLNDVGPELDPAGLARIRGYVGRSGSWPTWLHAARFLAEGNRDTYPEYEIQDWLAMAKRLCRLTNAGRVVFDYDMKIAEPFRAPEADQPVDLWPLWDAMKAVPMLLVRGAISDVLSAATVERMRARHPALETVTVPDVGHAPTLDEPVAAEAIERFLARLDGTS